VDSFREACLAAATDFDAQRMQCQQCARIERFPEAGTRMAASTPPTGKNFAREARPAFNYSVFAN
jgi:hypothetical protein